MKPLPDVQIDLVILELAGITVTPEQVSAVRGGSKRQAIAWLRERGIRTALDTGFDRETTELLLGALGWRDAVASVAEPPTLWSLDGR